MSGAFPAVRSAGQRVAALVLCALLIAVASSAARAQDPPGDYGDAPDDATHFFPTIYHTTHSRVGGHGANHAVTGLEMLGMSVSVERGATDPADPDGAPNLVNGDSDNGLIGVATRAYGGPFPGGPALTELRLGVMVTLAPGAPPGPRFLNILMDTNRDGRWRAAERGPEWVAENVMVLIAPGTSAIVELPIGAFDVSTTDPNSDMWMRITLTRSEIDPAPFIGVGGWDGSGDFAFGETEDYILYHGGALVPPPFVPTCDCRFSLTADPNPLIIEHGGGGTLKWTLTVRGSTAGGCPVFFDGVSEAGPGPAMGLGVSSGAKPGEIGAPVFAGPIPVAPFVVQYTLTVPIVSLTHHDVGIIQSFGVRARFHGNCPNGSFAFVASKQCGVIIVHPTANGDVLFSVLNFGGAFVQPVGVALPLNTPGGPPIGTVTFGNSQPTPGVLRAVQFRHRNPFVFPQTGTLQGELPVTTFFTVEFDPDPNLPENQPEVQTTITGLGLNGYTPQDVIAAGISNETSLRPQRLPLDSNAYQANILQISEQVGGTVSVDPVGHLVSVFLPKGFSAWTLGRPGVTLTDCDADGSPDVQEIGLGTGADCFARSAPLVNGHYAMGGPDLALDRCQCLADWDRNGAVNPADVAQFVTSWFYSLNHPGNLDADMDCNGAIQPADVAVFVSDWFAGLTFPGANGC